MHALKLQEVHLVMIFARAPYIASIVRNTPARRRTVECTQSRNCQRGLMQSHDEQIKQSTKVVIYSLRDTVYLRLMSVQFF